MTDARRLRIALGATFAAAVFLLGPHLHPLPCECASTVASAAVTSAEPRIETTELRIEGMTCGGCASNLQKALTGLDGVVEATVTYEPPRAKISYDLTKIRMRDIVRAIERAGFTPFKV